MTRATATDKELVVDILMQSFDDNKSVNYIIKQDKKRRDRIRGLMEYSYDLCSMFGDVFLSEDRTGCALAIKPDNKKTTLNSILLDIRFIIHSLGPGNIKKAMSREATIKQVQPDNQLYYLWFIGVNPCYQNKGVGSKLLSELICEGQSQNRTICLETSTLKNLPWYKKFGFTVYHQFDFGYDLYCMKRD